MYTINYTISHNNQQHINKPYKQKRLKLLTTKTKKTYQKITYIKNIKNTTKTLITKFNETHMITLKTPLISKQTHKLQLTTNIIEKIETTKNNKTITHYKHNKIITPIHTFQTPYIKKKILF